MKDFKILTAVCLFVLFFVSAEAQTSVQTNAADYNTLKRIAGDHIKNKNYNAAIVELNKILQTKPDDVQTLYDRAWAYYNLKSFEPSLSDLNKIIAADPSKLSQSATSLDKKVMTQVQFDIFKRRSYSLRAFIYMEQNNQDAAIADARTTLSLNCNDRRAYTVLEKLLPLEQYAAEVQKQVAVVEKFEDLVCPEPYFQRAYIYSNKEQYDLAAADAVRFLALDKTNGFSQDRENFWIFLENYYKDKADAYNAALTQIINTRDSKPYEALHHRARNYFRQKKFDSAITDLTRLIGYLSPAQMQETYSISLHSLRARAYFALNKFDLALLDVNKVISTNFSIFYDYEVRAQIYCQAGKKTEAAADEKMVVKLGGTVTNPCK